uniref:Uncharacterized protein n=1 Tax=Anguilla anguilla TaxID=7936 RepID=A0A0E9RA83_ANGAN
MCSPCSLKERNRATSIQENSIPNIMSALQLH